MTAPEAKAKLEAWADLLKAKLEGVSSGPWYVDADRRPNMEWNDQITRPGGIRNDGLTVCFMSNDEWKGGAGEKPDSNFIALSRSAVPAMLAGIEAMLKQWEKTQTRTFPNDPDMTFARQADSNENLIAMAEAYEPYFQEVQS